MSVATLQLGFMVWPPTADRGAALPLVAVLGRPIDTNTCPAHRCGRDRLRAPEASSRHPSPRDTNPRECGWRTDAGSRARAVLYFRRGAAGQPRGTSAR